MESFFSQHWQIATTLFSALGVAVMLLGGALVRMKVQAIEARLDFKRRHIEDLQRRVAALEGNQGISKVIIANLSDVLKEFVQEIKMEVKEFRTSNWEEHNDIKKLILREATDLELEAAT